jgi:hypothetical protein
MQKDSSHLCESTGGIFIGKTTGIPGSSLFPMKMALPFSYFMPDRTAVMGGLCENTADIFTGK